MANANMTMTVKLASADRKLLERIARALEKANGVSYVANVPGYRDVEQELEERERSMTDEYPTCVNCGGRIQKINFALGPEWRHWPTPHGNYRTNEMYRYCQSAALVATPKSEEQEQ